MELSCSFLLFVFCFFIFLHPSSLLLLVAYCSSNEIVIANCVMLRAIVASTSGHWFYGAHLHSQDQQFLAIVLPLPLHYYDHHISVQMSVA